MKKDEVTCIQVSKKFHRQLRENIGKNLTFEEAFKIMYDHYFKNHQGPIR